MFPEFCTGLLAQLDGAPYPNEMWNRAIVRRLGATFVIGASLATVSCTRIAQELQLRHYDSVITDASRAYGRAADDAQRARALSDRGHALSDKARYSRAFKLIASDVYEREFALALKDHAAAIALAPGDAYVYQSRGRTYYDRLTLEQREKDGVAAMTKSVSAQAEADFTKALTLSPRFTEAFDMRGVVRIGAGDLDGAISDFEQERKLDAQMGALRLADALCLRASSEQRAGRDELALADYERAISLRQPRDGCSCDPYLAAETLKKKLKEDH